MSESVREQLSAKFHDLSDPLAAFAVAGMNFVASWFYSFTPEAMNHWAAIITALAGAGVTLATLASIILKCVKQWRELPPVSREPRWSRVTRFFQRKQDSTRLKK